ncbi:MAG: hypothetical protein LBJ64_11630 [Deltaproteobacteria bacterium]|nr:hypothetical protein [Deltaproteobacteria bacterium]
MSIIARISDDFGKRLFGGELTWLSIGLVRPVGDEEIVQKNVGAKAPFLGRKKIRLWIICYNSIIHWPFFRRQKQRKFSETCFVLFFLQSFIAKTLLFFVSNRGFMAFLF